MTSFIYKYLLCAFILMLIITVGVFYLYKEKNLVEAHFHFSDPQTQALVNQFLEQYGITEEMLDLLSSPGEQFLQLQQMLSDVQTSLQITTTPTHPGIREQVVIKIESFHTNLNAAQIGWFLNGNLQKSGMGENTFTFTTGALGETSRINVVIRTAEGNVFEREIFINPSEMDIIWEADTYTPPFYRGKALNTHESSLRLTAVPIILDSNGQRINPNSLIYKWTLNGSVLGDQSGYGRNSITVENRSISRNMRIIAEASTLDGQTTVRERIDLSPVNPQVHLYSEHPNYGVTFEKSLHGQQLMNDTEMTIRALPFFFSKESIGNGDVVFTWNMNNRPVTTLLADPTLLTVRQEEEMVGLSSISVRLRNHGKTRQQAQNNFSLRLLEI